MADNLDLELFMSGVRPLAGDFVPFASTTASLDDIFAGVPRDRLPTCTKAAKAPDKPLRASGGDADSSLWVAMGALAAAAFSSHG
jgi:hypothetical protein